MGVKELADFIQRERKAKGLTQQQLASAAGVGLKTVNNLERGAVDPRWETVEAVAQGLGLSPRDVWYIYDPGGNSLPGEITPEEAARALEQWNKEEKDTFFNLIGLGAIRKLFGRESD